VLGIELNPYAAELARVSTWIAEIQWMRRNGFEAATDPILKPLGTIECRDAVLGPDGGPADWPEAEFIVGNPPFLGNKRMIAELGEEYATTLRRAWGDVPGGVDLVAYWVAAAWRAVEAGRTSRVGLVTTNSIRGGANRAVLTGPAEASAIFEAWSDEPWTVAGAAVRVSMVMLGEATDDSRPRLDGAEVKRIAADLTAGLDLTTAARLEENADLCFQGVKFGGPFDISSDVAHSLLTLRGNPNGLPNSDVVRQWVTGLDITRRPATRWCVDFGEYPKLCV
jgi:type II restriction/modification system DNA methylase subunit YeeA